MDNVFVLLSFQLPKLVVESSVPWEEGLILMKWDLFVVVVLPWTFLHRLVVTSSLLQLSFYVGSASVVHKFFLCLFQDESGSLSSGESDIGVDDDEDELLDDDDMEDGRGEGRDDGSQANSLNDSDNDF